MKVIIKRCKGIIREIHGESFFYFFLLFYLNCRCAKSKVKSVISPYWRGRWEVISHTFLNIFFTFLIPESQGIKTSSQVD